MRTKHKLLGLLLTLLICLAPWNGVALAEKLPEIVAIDILTTNDFHGALVEAGKNPGAAKFGAFLLQQRAKNPYGSIFVSAGDMFQGSPDSNLLYGKTVVEVLNALQMDAMTLGNHEFDWGLDKLAARVAESRFPYVSANVREKDGQGRLSFVKPFVMLERLGVKIAVIGIVTPETAYTTGPKIVAPFEFRDPATVVRELLPQVRRLGADIVVVLSHLASEQDAAGQVSGDAAVLAATVPGVTPASAFNSAAVDVMGTPFLAILTASMPISLRSFAPAIAGSGFTPKGGSISTHTANFFPSAAPKALFSASGMRGAAGVAEHVAGNDLAARDAGAEGGADVVLVQLLDHRGADHPGQ